MNEAEVTKYLDDFPSVTEIKRKLLENHRERQLLRQMLKIAEQRHVVDAELAVSSQEPSDGKQSGH